jgi:hypothetical protein
MLITTLVVLAAFTGGGYDTPPTTPPQPEPVTEVHVEPSYDCGNDLYIETITTLTYDFTLDYAGVWVQDTVGAETIEVVSSFLTEEQITAECEVAPEPTPTPTPTPEPEPSESPAPTPVPETPSSPAPAPTTPRADGTDSLAPTGAITEWLVPWGLAALNLGLGLTLIGRVRRAA